MIGTRKKGEGGAAAPPYRAMHSDYWLLTPGFCFYIFHQGDIGRGGKEENATVPF